MKKDEDEHLTLDIGEKEFLNSRIYQMLDEAYEAMTVKIGRMLLLWPAKRDILIDVRRVLSQRYLALRDKEITTLSDYVYQMQAAQQFAEDVLSYGDDDAGHSPACRSSIN